jgi:hypothetical protein
MPGLTHAVVHRAATQPHLCDCREPMPVERAARKGAALVVCQRCGLSVPARLRR